MNSVHYLGSVQEFGIWKIEIRDRKCAALLQGSEMSAGDIHFISLRLGLGSCQMATLVVSPWSSGQRNKTQLLKPQFDLQEGRTHAHQFYVEKERLLQKKRD